MLTHWKVTPRVCSEGPCHLQWRWVCTDLYRHFPLALLCHALLGPRVLLRTQRTCPERGCAPALPHASQTRTLHPRLTAPLVAPMPSLHQIQPPTHCLPDFLPFPSLFHHPSIQVAVAS